MQRLDEPRNNTGRQFDERQDEQDEANGLHPIRGFAYEKGTAMTIATVQTTEVLLQAVIGGEGGDPEHDPSEPLEAVTHLPMVPRKGDTLEVWLEGKGLYGKRAEYLTVAQVTFCTWAPERILVSVSTDGHGIAALKRIFQAVDANEQP